jgi:feruloyl esterase
MDAASVLNSFRPDDLTTVVAVKAFKAGDPLVISEPVNDRTPRAKADLLLVKLNVGPGTPGPADAPSTSPGIGIEVWLPAPAAWDERVHALGGNGWSGGDAGSPARVANSMFAAGVAVAEGSVVSTCDSGHSGQRMDLGGVAASNADFAMGPDGSPCRTQWREFSSRCLEQQALKTKALAEFYYGRPAKRAYFEGLSLGGRQGYTLAQRYPELYDGIVANMPALNWTRFFTAALYPDIVFLRDLAGERPTEAQLDFVSNAAIHACDVVGGEHLGYIMDPSACRYDPTEDLDVICVSDGGRSTSPHCVTRAQAAAINKLWYGMTSDGSAPGPARDNGWDTPIGGVRRWYGRPAGTSLYSASMKRMFGISPGATGADMVALELQDPTLAPEGFRNASGDGAGLWRGLSYEQLSDAFDRGLALQPEFDDINSDDPDLSAYMARGGKILTWHGLNDEAIPVQGTIQYFEAVAAQMGAAAVDSFLKLYLVPGVGHYAGNGTSDPNANPPLVVWGQFYRLLVDWVENGAAPDRIEIATPPTAPTRITQPIFPYPQKPQYVGGDPRVTENWVPSKG